MTDLDRLEKLAVTDYKYCCVNFRRSFKKFSIHVNMIAMNIIKRKSFEAFIIFIIFSNCMTLTMSKANQEPTSVETTIENIFQGIYTVEMVLKILGMGLIFNKGAYLRDYFNMLDFFIVVSAYLSMMQSGKD